MDFVNTMLVTLPQPTGFWESILNAFKGINGTYILAVIFIAILVRVVFSFVDILNKKVSMKSNEINTKMKPELDAIKEKYQNDPAKMKQKTDEVYKKYQFNVMGSCLPMLVMLVLQTVVFLTLWNSLQTVSNYNIASQYNEMKNIYANVLVVNKQIDEDKITFEDGNTIEIKLGFQEQEGKNVRGIIYTVYTNNEEPNAGQEYFVPYKTDWTNREVFDLISQYVLEPEPEEPPAEDASANAAEEDENAYVPQEYNPNGFSEQIKVQAEKLVKNYYLNTQEGFLWIKNIYKPDAPQSPLFTESEIENYLSKYYSADEKADESKYKLEGKIFNSVTAGINAQALGSNGYYILTILAVAFSVLSMWLSNLMMRRKDQPKQKQSIAMYIIMPLIFGLFTFMYTSLFAIYLVVGQLATMATTPLTTWIVKMWTKTSDKKKKEKDVIEVDYRRK